MFLADFQDLLPAFFLDMARALRTIGSPLEKFTIESPHGMPELNGTANSYLLGAATIA